MINTMIKIRTRDGQEISVTPDHMLLVYSKDENSILWKSAKDILDKDFVLCMRSMDIKRKKDIGQLELIQMLPQKKINKILVKLKDKNIGKEIIDQNKYAIKESTFYKYVKNNKFPLQWFISFVREKKINDPDSLVEHFLWSSGRSKPENFSLRGFFYLLGLTLGDGHI